MSRGNLAVHDFERIALATRPTEDGRAIKVKFKCLGELARWVAYEADLRGSA